MSLGPFSASAWESSEDSSSAVATATEGTPRPSPSLTQSTPERSVSLLDRRAQLAGSQPGSFEFQNVVALVGTDQRHHVQLFFRLGPQGLDGVERGAVGLEIDDLSVRASYGRSGGAGSALANGAARQSQQRERFRERGEIVVGHAGGVAFVHHHGALGLQGRQQRANLVARESACRQ